jgi:DNA helicase-2/ATP-dependent DNA helicase PcrA
MAGLTTEQAKAAAQYGPVLVLAGAGTGKTKTLTAAVVHRIAAGGLAPGRVLAVTFTNKAATEMSGRIRAALDSGPALSWLGTFHGLAARQLRIEPEVAGLRPGFDILDADDSRRVVKRTLKALNLASGEDAAAIGRDPLKLMCSRLSKFKDNLITPDEAPAASRGDDRRSQPQRPTGRCTRPARQCPGLCRLPTPVAGRERRRFRGSAAVAGARHAAQRELPHALGVTVRLRAR